MQKYNVGYLFETAVGLGHQRRASGIVNGMIAAGFEVSVASGSFVEAENYFDYRANLIPLPAHHRKKDGVYFYYNVNSELVPDPDFDPVAWHEQRVAAVRPLASAKPIDALLAEWWPFKRRDEFDDIIATIMTIQQESFGSRPLLLSSVRDDQRNSEPERESIIADKINQSVDAVLVHSDPVLVPFEDGFHEPITKPVIYTGYVVNEGAKSSHLVVRDKTVIVSCGSGDIGHNLLKAAYRAMPYAHDLREHEWHFVMGPRMEAHHREDFFAVVQQSNGSHGAFQPNIHPQLAQLPEVLVRSGFSVSLGGYNTTMEILASHIPAVLTAKFKEQDGQVTKFEMEQWKRLVRLSEREMTSRAHPEEVLNPRVFGSLIDAAFAKGPSTQSLNMEGAVNTAKEVELLIEQHRKRANHTLIEMHAPIPEQADKAVA